MANRITPIRLRVVLAISLLTTLSAVPSTIRAQTIEDAVDEEEDDSSGNGHEVTLTLDGYRRTLLPDTDPVTDTEQELVAGLEFSLNHSLARAWQLHTELLLETEQRQEADRSRSDSRSRASLEQLTLEWFPRSKPNLYLSAGRQDVIEARGWWWDATIDGVSLSGDADRYRYGLALGTRANDISTDNDPIDPEDDQILYLLSSIDVQLRDDLRTSVFLVHAEDRSTSQGVGQSVLESDFDESDARLSWFGVRLGWTSPSLRIGRYDWLVDSGLLRGRDRVAIPTSGEGEDDEDEDDVDVDDLDEDILDIGSIDSVSIRAWALDTSIDWHLPLPLTPTLGVRYARGSGTRSGRTEGERSYRQSGLQENADEFAWYGELFNPDLTNIELLATRLTLRPTTTWAVSLIHYQYRRLYPDSAIGDTGIEADPDGPGHRLGEEIGLYLFAELEEDWQIAASVSRFQPGKAYRLPRDRSSLQARIEIEFEF